MARQDMARRERQDACRCVWGVCVLASPKREILATQVYISLLVGESSSLKLKRFSSDIYNNVRCERRVERRDVKDETGWYLYWRPGRSASQSDTSSLEPRRCNLMTHLMTHCGESQLTGNPKIGTILLPKYTPIFATNIHTFCYRYTHFLLNIHMAQGREQALKQVSPIQKILATRRAFGGTRDKLLSYEAFFLNPQQIVRQSLQRAESLLSLMASFSRDLRYLFRNLCKARMRH